MIFGCYIYYNFPIMDERILTAICFALLIMVIFLIQCINGPGSETMIHGFWNVSDQFKEKANLDQLIIYFDEGKGYEYQGYMVMVVDGDTVYNGTLQFRIIPKGYFKSDTYTFITSKRVGIMPQTMTMELCPYSGGMALKCLNTKKLYAELYKDNQMSAKTILNIGDSNEAEEDSSDIKPSKDDSEKI